MLINSNILIINWFLSYKVRLNMWMYEGVFKIEEAGEDSKNYAWLISVPKMRLPWSSTSCK